MAVKPEALDWIYPEANKVSINFEIQHHYWKSSNQVGLACKPLLENLHVKKLCLHPVDVIPTKWSCQGNEWPYYCHFNIWTKSFKVIPSVWVKPLATNHALWLSIDQFALCLTLNTHLHPTTFLLGRIVMGVHVFVLVRATSFVAIGCCQQGCWAASA